MSNTTVDSIATGSSATDLAAARIPQKILGQQDFLNLLVAQLKAQDPLNPMKDTEFIAQMAQFSALEQSKSMSTELARLRTDQQFTQASGLLGRTVQLQVSQNSAPVEGTVSAVAMQAGTPQIVIDGQAYGLDQLYSLTVGAPKP